MKRALLAAAAALLWGCDAARRVPPTIVSLPEFTMTSVAGDAPKPFGRADMLGKVWVADFIFTRCSGPCPLMSEKMKGLAKTLPAEARLLTISVDPEGDTPERLRAYARRLEADPARWVFLRGGLKETYDLLYAGFRLPISIDPGVEAGKRVTHSTRFVLIDRAGAIRGYYDAFNDLDNAALVRDARRLLEVGS